jgi:putative ABC transport system permease protein
MQMLCKPHRYCDAKGRCLPLSSGVHDRRLFARLSLRLSSDAWLSSFFAGFAVLIAFLGLYAALAYAVTRRTREFGVRIALGAARSDVVRMLLGEVIGVTLVGIAIGIPFALATGRLSASLLFGLTPSDPATIAAAAGCFTIVGVAAGLRPALRAARMDPMAALRSD